MAAAVRYVESPVPAFLFDLDGTLIDSVYQHVIAWRSALSDIGIELSVWRHAKPDPDLFLAAAAVLGVDPGNAMVVGDSVWDLLAARRAGALGVGLLSGGYGREELERSGAYRVYADPAEMLARVDELGVRTGPG
jgi:phosphoglycolate phosphatase-like HAD superfamily hydrolase